MIGGNEDSDSAEDAEVQRRFIESGAAARVDAAFADVDRWVRRERPSHQTPENPDN